MSQAPLPLLSALPQIDPQVASIMRPGESGEGFSAIASFFGLDPAAATEGGAASLQAGSGANSEHGNGPVPQETRLLELLRQLQSEQPAEGGQLDELLWLIQGEQPAQGGQPSELLQLIQGEQSLARSGQSVEPGERFPDQQARADRATSMLEALLKPAGADRAAAEQLQAIRELPARNGAQSTRLSNELLSNSADKMTEQAADILKRLVAGQAESTRAPALVPNNSSGAAPPSTIDASLQHSLHGQAMADKVQDAELLAKSLQDFLASQRGESMPREASTSAAELSANQPQASRAAAGSESLLAARGDFGLQLNAASAQPTLTGSPPPAPAQASMAAGQTFDHVALMLRQGVSEARLQLKPANLGQVDIRIEIEGNEARVQLTVQQAQVREALEQLLPRLREALAGQGVELSDASVDHSGQHSPDQEGEPSDDRDRAPGWADAADTGDLADKAGLRIDHRSPTGLVDAYA